MPQKTHKSFKTLSVFFFLSPLPLPAKPRISSFFGFRKEDALKGAVVWSQAGFLQIFSLIRELVSELVLDKRNDPIF